MTAVFHLRTMATTIGRVQIFQELMYHKVLFGALLMQIMKETSKVLENANLTVAEVGLGICIDLHQFDCFPKLC